MSRGDFFEQSKEWGTKFMQFLRGTKAGAKCPSCSRHCQVYDRLINATIGKQLIELYKTIIAQDSLDDWVHRKKISGPDFSIARFWGLVEQRPNYDNPEKKDSGYWRLTDSGVKFVKGEITVPKYATLYNNQLLELHGEDWNIKRSLGRKFDYEELMYGEGS